MNAPGTSRSQSSSSSSPPLFIPLLFPLTKDFSSAHASPSFAMTGMGQVLDAATAAASRATRRKKIDAKKRVKNAPRQPAAAPSGRAHLQFGNVQNLNVMVQDPDLTLDGLTYLLKKELRNSDVNHHGRIILPKKDSEDNLPTLEVKEGISMVMDDYTSLQAWTFKYRYWPNNKSRMYVLENTGDYVKSHGLQIGDLVILYKDDKNDRYVIRARKATSTEGETVAASIPQDNGIIMPDLALDMSRNSELFQPLSDGLMGMDYDYGQGYDFMQDLPPAPLPDDNTHIGSTLFIEPMSPWFGWEP